MEETEEETVARYVGQIVAILEIMNHKYPGFKSLVSFQLLLDDGAYMQGASVSKYLEGEDFGNLLINIEQAYAERYDDGTEFEIDLAKLIMNLRNDVEGDPGGEK
jgi:hypothetical protein